MSNGAKRNKKIGTIRWAIVLAFIVTFFSVVSYLLTMAIRFYYYGHAGDNVFAWSVAIYQIMGSLCGIVIAIISVMLYHRMEKLLNGMEDVANGKLDVEIPIENSGEYKVIYENFNQMVRELKNADEQQKQFMKDFSHEFKVRSSKKLKIKILIFFILFSPSVFYLVNNNFNHNNKHYNC